MPFGLLHICYILVLSTDIVLSSQAGADLKLWVDLRKLWRDLTRMQLSFWDYDDSDDENGANGGSSQETILRQLSMGLAKFTRNLVAGVPANQVRA